jgi:hypothetical protein
MLIKAIDTEYGGSLFRSRLEARWAVFFDSLGIAWEHETEGFEMEGVGRYLPDFWLPQVSMWAEVKPGEFSPKERDKCRALAVGTDYPCLMLDGMPDYREYDAFLCYSDPSDAEGAFSVMTIPVTLGTEHICEGRFFVQSEFKSKSDFPEAYAEAVSAARKARFEFQTKKAIL